MKLYHGSNIRFEKIDLSVSKPNKDFGKGFYLSDSFEQAMEMAEFKIYERSYIAVFFRNRRRNLISVF